MERVLRNKVYRGVSKTRLGQKKELNCDAIAPEASADPTRT